MSAEIVSSSPLKQVDTNIPAETVQEKKERPKRVIRAPKTQPAFEGVHTKFDDEGNAEVVIAEPAKTEVDKILDQVFAEDTDDEDFTPEQNAEETESEESEEETDEEEEETEGQDLWAYRDAKPVKFEGKHTVFADSDDEDDHADEEQAAAMKVETQDVAQLNEQFNKLSAKSESS
jgi:hypothetical protein